MHPDETRQRLEAVPATRFCVDDQAVAEGHVSRRTG
jgi:RNA polymerase-binding transcription factor DksA